MTSQPDTHVVVLTPEGRGAIASLLVAGPRAAEIVGELFRPLAGRPFGDQPLARILFGRFLLSADSAEEVVVCRRCAERVEIHCHGGAVAARAMIGSLAKRGCRETSWREWARRTALDPIAFAAEIALAAAPTERTAAILWDQRAGALRRALDEIAERIAAGRADDAARLVDELLARAPLGRHLVEPWHVVLAGLPNVGKSSLINALVGYERAIVHATPGTTRDIVTASAAIDGWPVELSDTAGLHANAGPIESAGIELARKRMATADLVVLVFDASIPWSDDDQALTRDWPGALCVLNKCDLLAPDSRPDVPIGGWRTSAKLGDGIAELGARIAKRLVPTPPARGQAVPLTARQVAALERIREQLATGRSSTAAEVLARNENWGDESC